MARSPINRVALTDEIYIRILDEILTGSIQSGEKLDIALLAETYQVSRQPIKAAITRLSAEGLLVIKPQRGTYVRSISIEEAKQIIQVRMMMETWAVTHIPRKNQDLLRRLQVLAEGMSSMLNEEPFHWNAYNEADIQFHETLVALAANPELTRGYQALHSHYVTAHYYYNDRNITAHRDGAHSLIVQALIKEEVELARQLVEKHIQEAMDLLREPTMNEKRSP